MKKMVPCQCSNCKKDFELTVARFNTRKTKSKSGLLFCSANCAREFYAPTHGEKIKKSTIAKQPKAVEIIGFPEEEFWQWFESHKDKPGNVSCARWGYKRASK